MSSEFPRRLPRYLHVFQSVSDVLQIVYSSVLSWITIKFLLVWIVRIVCLISSIMFLFVVAQEVSSEYCVSTKRQPVKEITLVRCVHNAWIDMCSLLVSVPIHTQGCTSVVHAFVYASHACTHGTCIARMSCMRTLVRIAGFDWELKLGIGTWE